MHKPQIAASNPVAPTIFFQEFLKVPSQKPVAQPVTGESRQVWTALAEIGRQLEILARAQSGQGNFSAHTSPPPVADSLSLVELVNQFLLAKARSGRSDRYLRALRNSLSKFLAGRAHKPIAEIEVAEIERWMQRPEWQPRTQRGYLGDVRTLFNFAVRRGLLVKNPAAGVELPTMASGAVEIHTPAETKTVLDFARLYCPNICRALAVRYFAGLRSAEVERITENQISEKYIEVTESISKGARARRRRLVLIQPNLRAWLALGGILPVRGNKSNVWRDFNAALFRATGTAWHDNVTRKSFASYHLAKFENAGKTALEAGHTEQMLFSNYREIATQEAATEFFNIVPQ